MMKRMVRNEWSFKDISRLATQAYNTWYLITLAPGKTKTGTQEHRKLSRVASKAWKRYERRRELELTKWQEEKERQNSALVEATSRLEGDWAEHDDVV